MKSQIDVSVVIPHYGDPAPTHALIDSLLTQEGATTAEIIVADDFSPVPFAARPGVVVVRRETNGGFGRAVNSGAAVARGHQLLILNSDLDVGPSFLADLLEAAVPWHPAVMSPRVVDREGVEAWTGRHFPTVRHQASEWLTPLARWRNTRHWHEAVGHDTTARGKDTVVDWVVGAAILVPIEEFRAVGGFDDRFFMNSEEVDLQRRLRARGLPSVALAAPTVTHEGGGSSPSHQRRQWVVDSRMQYADKWGSRRALRAALIACTGANLTFHVVRRAAGRDVHPLRTAREEFSLLRRTDQADR